MLNVYFHANTSSSLISRLSILPILVLGLAVPIAAQVTYTGTTASQNFGSVAIGSPKTVSFSFSVAAGTTVGSIGVVTQGAPNLDFTSAAGTTCTATTYASAATCSVSVTFTPKAAGLRIGAVVFFSAANNTGIQLGSVPISGTGTGPQIAFGLGAVTAIAPVVNAEGLDVPSGIAVDGAGDLFIADVGNNRVLEVPAGGSAAIAIDPTVNGNALYAPEGIAVDGAGDLFIADSDNNRVVEVPGGGSAAIAIDPVINGKGLATPYGLAVDGAGNLFISDLTIARVVEVPAGGGGATAIDPTVHGVAVASPRGITVDAAGDLFIADGRNDRVVEVPAGGGAAIAIDPTVNGEALSVPEGLAEDGAGDLFIADIGNNRVVEVPAGNGTPLVIDPTVNGESLNEPWGVALDSGGDLFITDAANNRLVELQRSQPPTVDFPTPTPLGATDTGDGTQTVQIQNIGTEPLQFSVLSYPDDFPEASGDSSACTGSTSLNAGQECDLPINFTPENSGPALSEDLVLTDNALNVTGAQQSITVTGTTASNPDTLYIPMPGSALKGPEVTFSWTPASGATGYSLWIGSTGAGSVNVYCSHETTATSVKVAGLPTNGETLYVRLYTTSGKTTVHSDYTYTAETQAALLSPQPNTSLGGTTITFTWSAATGATEYSLWMGNAGPGSDNVYISHAVAQTSATAVNLPNNGETLYVRLYTIFSNGTSVYGDYTYRAE